MRRFLIPSALILTALPLAAQQDNADRGVLEAFIEDRLSQAGRDVNITGFQGALSSQATLEELTIADEDGIWLTLRGAELDWSRAALLRGRVQVQALTAEEIILERLPAGQGGPKVEDSEAQPFQLPDLPVSIEIGRLATDRLELGPTVLGQAAELSIEAALRLAGGAGAADIAATRTDAEARYAIVASYANDSRDLAVDLALSEGSGGLIGATLGLPGAPPLALTVTGEGPLSDFTADIALATDGVDRVSGDLTLSEPETGALGFALDLSGDVAPLVAERVRPFFGDSAQVRLAGQKRPDGGTDLSRLDIATGALTLSGSLALAPTGLPERLSLDGTLQGPVTLPLSGPETRVNGLRLTADFDEATGERWQARATLTGLSRDGLDLGRAELAGAGTIRPEAPAALTADITFAATGLNHENPALARALGQALNGAASLAYAADAPLRLNSLTLTAGDARATASGTLGELADGLPLDGRATVSLADLGRLAPLAGRPLGGAASARIEGKYGLLDGIFDVALTADTTDLATGTPRLDPLLRGPGTLALNAARGPEGTRLRALDVETRALDLSATGDLSATTAGLEISGNINDLSLVDRQLSGPGTIDTRLAWEDGGRIRIASLQATGPGTRLQASGAITPDDPSLPVDGTLSLTTESLAPFSGLAGRPLRGAIDTTLTASGAVKGDITAEIDATAQNLALGIAQLDRLLAGQTTLSARGGRQGGTPSLAALDLRTPVLSLGATGAGGQALDVDGRLTDLALVAPGFPGPLTLRGRVDPGSDRIALNLDATGPGGTTAAIRGSLSPDASRADLQLSGQAPLALVNGFIEPRSLNGQVSYDLALNGPLALSSLTGQATTSGARASLPTLNIALTDLGGRVNLQNGQARLDLGAAIDGGRITVQGPITLASPYDAELAIALDRARLSDPDLYDTRLDGQITVVGPLTGGARIGGRIDLGRTEVQVPETGAGAAGPIPQIAHRGESAAQRATRDRAGLLKAENGGGGGGRPYPLDLTISAPSQVFVRGRGLDAEVGGLLRVRGTSADVAPEGRFDLIRGRLDILSRRFTLAEGQVSLQGALDPYLRFVAQTTRSDDFTGLITIEGRASAPEITFSSQPELPEDEVIARILFGRSIGELSAVQAVQLAAGVASLAGGNGGGGVLGRVRESTGLDEIDLRTTPEGQTEVTVGKYLTDNIYSEVTVDAEGKSEIDLNLDLTPNITVKGSLDAEGGTGIGVFYERDY